VADAPGGRLSRWNGERDGAKCQYRQPDELKYQGVQGNSAGSNRKICAEGIDRLLISGRGCEWPTGCWS
jgi:hypothetical protein